jgi:hypothetical protein
MRTQIPTRGSEIGIFSFDNSSVVIFSSMLPFIGTVPGQQTIPKLFRIATIAN